MNNLCIIQAYDRLGYRHWRTCGKLITSSLIRHTWEGTVHLLRNQPEPLFPTGREELVEKIDESFEHHANSLEQNTTQPNNGKTNEQTAARNLLLDYCSKIDPKNYTWILLADADCITLRNLDHLFDPSADILILTEKESRLPDPGFIAIHTRIFLSFITQWLEERKKSTSLLNHTEGLLLHNIISRNNWRVADFERGEVVRAVSKETTIADIAHAAVVHLGGLPLTQKKNLAFALHMMSIYSDDDGLFFDMLES